jgi:hypothetical protein
LFTPEKQG